MPRIKCNRCIGNLPNVTYYKPAGIPLAEMGEINLHFKELEAMRLSHVEGKYQKEAAKEMGISRQTYGRILEVAHKKVSEALVYGKAIKIEGGNYKLENKK